VSPPAIVVRVGGSRRSEYRVDAASPDEALATALRLELAELAREAAAIEAPASATRAPLGWRLRRPRPRPRAERLR
jgi:hypothetical protein